nr:uncharacterized protein LOC109151883 [Ipomoea batatas]
MLDGAGSNLSGGDADSNNSQEISKLPVAALRSSSEKLRQRSDGSGALDPSVLCVDGGTTDSGSQVVLVSALWIDLMRPMDDSVVFATWLDDVITAGPMVKVLRCVANCWCIWRGRNDLVWGGKSWQPLRIKNEVSHLLESWKCMMSTAVMANAQSM